jgi:hemolysin activation/secretion protein
MKYKANMMYRELILLGGVLLPGVALAQAVVVDPAQAGAQRIDGYYQQRQPVQPAPAGDPVQQPEPSTAATPAAVDGAAAVRFTLAELRFTPSSLLDASVLADIAQRHAGRQVSLADLDGIVAEVNAAYAARGITTAQAVLRPQDVAAGVVEITLVEGRLGVLEVTGEGKLPTRFVQRRVTPASGEVVDVEQLRRQLIYLNRTSDVQVRAVMRAGQGEGLTDIVLLTQAPAAKGWGVFVDNAGIESTGRERIGLQGQLWGLAGLNDLLSASLAWSEGGLEGRIGYSGLVNRRNGRLGVSVSRNQINLIDGAYRDLDITGESTSYGVDFNQPWLAGQHWQLSSQASLARSNSVSEITGMKVSETDATVASAGLSLGYRADGLDWSLSQNVASVRTDESLLGSRSFVTASGAATLMQRLGSKYLYRAQLGWQFTSSDNLPASNLFQVGGIGSVRGYERGVLSGVRGYYASLELHRPYRGGHDVYAFFDHGDVRGDFPAAASISSIGVGFNGQFAQRYSYSLDLGHPLDQVLAQQDSVRADVRISARW